MFTDQEAVAKENQELQELLSTTRSFLASKNKLVIEKNQEITTMRRRVSESDVRDSKRSKMLEELLCRLAAYEHQQGVMSQMKQFVRTDKRKRRRRRRTRRRSRRRRRRRRSGGMLTR